MARLAILSDVHGNVPALEAVLADLDAQRPDEVLVGGDLVGRGPQGSRVTEIIRRRGWRTIKGNHEDYLLNFRRGDIPEAWNHLDVWAAARWMSAELNDDDVAFLSDLPAEVRSTSLPEVLLVHGTPRSNRKGIGPWTSTSSMSRHLESIRGSVLVCAHTHRPLERRLDVGRIINAGSVGLPFNRDPRAQYVVLHGDGAAGSETIETEFRRVDYDRAEILAIYERSGFLAEGGVTARLLELEIHHAAPFLVPFLTWSSVHGVPQVPDSIPGFLRNYDPDHQREFWAELGVVPRSEPTGTGDREGS